MADAKERFVANPLNRYLVGDGSGLVANADGSTDMYIQATTQRGMSPTGCPHVRATSDYGSARICPARSFSMASTRCAGRQDTLISCSPKGSK
jgi:hypothetical protein